MADRVARTVVRHVVESIPDEVFLAKSYGYRLGRAALDAVESNARASEAITAAGLVHKRALVEASLNAELSHHLGYEAGVDRPELVTNQPAARPNRS